MSRLKVYDLATASWIYAGGVDPNAVATDPAFSSRYVALSSWVTTFDPVISQPGPITHTVAKSQWHYDGDMIEWECRIDITGTGTAPNVVSSSMPIAALSATNNSMGTGVIYDASTTALHVLGIDSGTVSSLKFIGDQAVGGNNWGINPNLALGSGDQIRFLVRYRWR